MISFARVIDTPVGQLLAVVDDNGALLALPFLDEPAEAYAERESHQLGGIQLREDVAEPVARELREYFDGSRRTFSLQLRPRGTDFQRLVWRAIEAIPFGETISYSELARRVGRGSARAVGRANATNPIPIVVPCHRVIGANGSLTGYGGGMERKQQLLAHEGAIQPLLPL